MRVREEMIFRKETEYKVDSDNIKMQQQKLMQEDMHQRRLAIQARLIAEKAEKIKRQKVADALEDLLKAEKNQQGIAIHMERAKEEFIKANKAALLVEELRKRREEQDMALAQVQAQERARFRR